MLLIDEPESSFDNLFLKNEVNEQIRDISKSIPVIIVTHNNTVGASIKPDYILYTKKEVVDKKPIFKIYSGNPSDHVLKSMDGEGISNYQIILNCLEAGDQAYNERGKTYEILKD
jgi:ABC-type phosphate transport system ATPase subunit